MSRHLGIIVVALFFVSLLKLATAADGITPLTNFAESRGASAKIDGNTLSLPFASDTKTDRSYADFDLKRDLSSCDEFKLTIDVSDAAAVGNVKLYFKCGAGWYSCGGSITGTGKQQLHFARSDFKPEDKPSGWDKAEIVRVAFWRGETVDASVKLLALEGVTLSTLVVVGDDDESRRTAWRVIGLCESAGGRVAQVSQSDVTPARLAHRQCVVLPLNPKLSTNAAAVALLKDFVAAGGKLIAFYQVAPELMQVLGFTGATYVKSPDGDAAFAEVRFETSDKVSPLPERLAQNSWNIISAKPLAGRSDAKIAAYWFDKSGRKTDHAALLVSESGAFFSHILTDGDRENKERFLRVLLSEYAPQMRRDILTELAQRIARIGQLSGDPPGRFAEKYQLQHETSSPFLVFAFKDKDAERELTNVDFAALYADGQRVYREMVAEYLVGLPSPRGEFRAWWEHAGTGAYAGDWDRTMRELAASGFTAVIPNMLWGGIAHYASDLLPRSATYEKYGDQIAQAVAAGKKHGIEVHVWKVNFNASYSPQSFIDAMTKEQRFQKKSDGTEQPWLCPSDPRNKKLECDAMLEVATNYDVDGIHFDYIRYPGNDSCFCDGCKSRFTQHVVDSDKTIPASWSDATSGWNSWMRDCTNGPFRSDYDDWRCDQITELVSMVRAGVDKLKDRKPHLKVSAAVFPAYPSCRKRQLQDWPVWVERGYLDFICPMDYTESVVQFSGYVSSQLTRVHNKIPVYPGIGATATGIAMQPEDVAVQIETLRQHNARGFTIFNLNGRTIQSVVPPLATGPTGK